MKKFFVLFFALLALASTAYATPYATIFEVYSIDTEDITIFIDSSGFLWEWEGSGEWKEGNLFAALMESNDTTIIEDDIIMEIYSKKEYFYPDEEWEEIPTLFIIAMLIRSNVNFILPLHNICQFHFKTTFPK